MRTFIVLTALLTLVSCKKSGTDVPSQPAEGMYFPTATDWAGATPESLNWNTSNLPALYTYLQQEDTRAFLVLKNGKIVLEKYFGQNIQNNGAFNQSSPWYWASAGKTLT